MKKQRFFLFIIFLSTLIIGIGYATVNEINLNIDGSITSAINGRVEITDAHYIEEEYSNVIDPSNPTINQDGTISFSANFNVTNENIETDEFYITYSITITNDSVQDFAFNAGYFNPQINTTNKKGTTDPEIIGIEFGEIIPAKTAKTFKVRINLHPESTGNINVSGDGTVEVTENDNGTIIASIPDNITIDLRGNNNTGIVPITVINSHITDENFTFSVSNPNFTLLDGEGNPLTTMQITANTENTYNISIKNDGARFPSDTQKINITFEPEISQNSNIGIVTILVDKDETLIDTTPPTVSNVKGDFQETINNVLVSWNGSDNVGIDYYVVEAFKGNSTTAETTLQTTADETQMLFTNIQDGGSYKFKVTAYDKFGNSTSAESSTATYKWTLSVTQNLSNTSSSFSAKTIMYGERFTATYSNNTPSSGNVTVTMGGSTLTSGTDYTYNNGRLTIEKVTGDLVIDAYGGGGCLVKGTKILLANGKTKNVEDINYDDLLAVWSYDTGNITYEYPLWIEKEQSTNIITRISFSDNTYLDIAYDHSLYDTDLNLFVNTLDNDHFKVGINIAKISKNGKFQKVTIVSYIEELEMPTTYYFVGTTRYYNVIANNVLTTDRTTIISNLYGFENNAIWPKEKDVITSKKNNVLNYSYFSDVLPYYLYAGFRAGEVGLLINNNIFSLEYFKDYITTYIINESTIKKPIQKNNINYWMVTTNYDKVNNSNRKNYLRKEGSMYKLPNEIGVKLWYSTADNKYYEPGTVIPVKYGMHFIAINNQ